MNSSSSPLNVELWRSVHMWLKACGARVDRNFCKVEITSHPEYPSLLSVVDFLDSGGMKYQAVSADISHIEEFNYPLLAHIKDSGTRYLELVPAAAEWARQAEMTSRWTGVVLFPMPGAPWNNPDNSRSLQRKRQLQTALGTLILLVTGLFLFSFLHTPGLLRGLFGLLSLSGLALGILAIGADLGIQNQTLKEICSTISEQGCDSVLNSEYAKSLKITTPADLALVYFSVQTVLYVLSAWRPGLLDGFLWIALAGIPVAAFSLFIQGIKLHKWCALCIAIAASLLAQAVIALILLPPAQSLGYAGLFIGLFLIIHLFFSPIKQLIKDAISNKTQLAEFKKWKMDPQLFLTQWSDQEEVDTSIWSNDLLIGERSATLQLTVACNPYCNPCARTHRVLDEILSRYSEKVKLQVRLVVNGPQREKRVIAAKAILKRASTVKSNLELKELLTDWFEFMNYEKWRLKWKTDDAVSVDRQLSQHTEWVANSDITYTPTLFINGRKVPPRYSVYDIDKLIPHLAK